MKDLHEQLIDEIITARGNKASEMESQFTSELHVEVADGMQELVCGILTLENVIERIL